ncbi:MAG: hypothetical protein K8T20_06195, partial [Planctomycetes bacterium]|nr:hypothetical protein [Planctomycetota bacterium]
EKKRRLEAHLARFLPASFFRPAFSIGGKRRVRGVEPAALDEFSRRVESLTIRAGESATLAQRVP